MKKAVAFVLILTFLLCMSSCGDGISTMGKDKIVAVKYGSDSETACEKFIVDGYSKVTYNLSSDVVLAVENMKADFGVLDEFELNSYINAGRNIEEKEICEYTIDYCAYFSSDNQELQDSFNEAIKELKADGKLDEIKSAHIKGEDFQSLNSNNENGTLTMLCDPSFENRVCTDDDGSIVGLDVDIAREICNYLGYDLEIVTADFDELFIKIDDGEGDFIISACQADEEKEAYYLASDTYFTLNFYLVKRK